MAVSFASKAPIAEFSGAGLDSLIVHPGLDPQPKEKRVFTGNGRVILFIWLTLSKEEVAPERLLHKLYFSTPDGGTRKNGEVEIDAPPVLVSKQIPIALTLPLHGSGWVAGKGPSNMSVHRRADFPFYGPATIPERYACDFVMLGNNGMAFTGDKTKNKNWYGFGAEVISVADGTVVDLQDGIPEMSHFPLIGLLRSTLKPAAGIMSRWLWGEDITPSLPIYSRRACE